VDFFVFAALTKKPATTRIAINNQQSKDLHEQRIDKKSKVPPLLPTPTVIRVLSLFSQKENCYWLEWLSKLLIQFSFVALSNLVVLKMRFKK